MCGKGGQIAVFARFRASWVTKLPVGYPLPALGAHSLGAKAKYGGPSTARRAVRLPVASVGMTVLFWPGGRFFFDRRDGPLAGRSLWSGGRSVLRCVWARRMARGRLLNWALRWLRIHRSFT